MKIPLILLFAASVHAQEFFQFQVDQDNLAGAPDFSFLNQPIEPKDRVFVRDGHFFKLGADLIPGTADDERVRFFGVNLAFSGNFPEEKDAARIARRLRKLGVNLVRSHHMDTQPDARAENANSILLSTGPYPTFNPIAVGRLRVFLDALKGEGIYANINLHVGYVFRPGVDGLPLWPGTGGFPTQSKPLHILYPRMIELQAQFTRELISQLQLKDDPVLAMVETNNETSLVYAWQSNQLDGVLLGEYRADATRQWNEFLSVKYGETGKLREAWAGGSSADGPELLTGQWRPLEVHSPAVARMEIVDGTAVVTVQNGGAPVILKQVGFSVEGGGQYLATVEIRADLASGQTRNVNWDIKQDVSPWRQTVNRTIAVTNQWQRVTLPFTAGFSMENIGRMGLSVENLPVPVYIRNASLHRVGRTGLREGESLEQADVAMVFPGDGVTPARLDDFLRFLADRDRAYHHSLLAAVRETTDDLVPVAGTQMGFGGLMLIDAQRGLDYADEHFYIDHYNFPNVSWDGRDWRFRDSSSVGGGLSTYLNVATKRIGLQPYTVSEFNQPFPNTYAAENDPALAAFGAFQDWDAIMHFAYEHGRNWDNVAPSGFNLNVDQTKLPGAGQAAWLFRSGAIEAGSEAADLPMPEPRRLEAMRERRNSNVALFLAERHGYEPLAAFERRVRLRPDLDGPLPDSVTGKRTGLLTSDTGQLSYHPGARRFIIQADRAAGFIGFLGTDPIRAGPVELQLSPSARGFTATIVTPLDGEPIAQSRRLLVSHPGYTLRTQAGSDPPRPQRIVNYPGTRDWFTLEPDPGSTKPSGNLNGGSATVWMERIEAALTLRSEARSISVWPLNGRGERQTVVEATRLDGGFLIRLQAEGQFLSPWFEIELEF